jgi:hypothetical protein
MSDRPPLDDFQKLSDGEAQPIYAHFLQCVERESPAQVIDIFRRLFIEGRGYNDTLVRDTVQKIVISKQADREYLIILYRCCQIAIEHWYQQPERQPAILELIRLFEQLPASLVSLSRFSSRCLQLTKSFTISEHYFKLQRVARVLDASPFGETRQNGYLGELLYRYPYLYKHCLLDEDCNLDYQRTIRKMRSRNQHNYEVALVQYLTYRIRLLQVARARQLSTGAGKLLRRVGNPILLDGDELKLALRQFSKRDGASMVGDLSFELLGDRHPTLSYKTFKENLYNYLVAIVDPEYVKNQFGKQLSEKLQSILPDSHSQKLSEFLMLRTYTQLLNFLVVESDRDCDRSVLTDLITNLGTTKTTNLLFKIVMLYPKIKPHLETRLTILFEYYEFVSLEESAWLIKVLENLQIAFSIHFGALDLSGLKLYAETQN